jgi:hypothetical protein
MRYLAAISTVAFAMLASQAFAQMQGYPAGGLGDAWAQDRPSSSGINNGYDPSTETYRVPHSGGGRTTAMPPYHENEVR